jgi:hypothetical protein
VEDQPLCGCCSSVDTGFQTQLLTLAPGRSRSLSLRTAIIPGLILHCQLCPFLQGTTEAEELVTKTLWKSVDVNKQMPRNLTLAGSHIVYNSRHEFLSQSDSSNENWRNLLITGLPSAMERHSSGGKNYVYLTATMWWKLTIVLSGLYVCSLVSR